MPAEPTSSALSVRPVSGRRDIDRFIELPFRLHAASERWVPPLRFERRAFLSRKRNPYFAHAEVCLFLAERGERVVGRISAQVDSRWDTYQGGNDGIFGFFECEDDPEVATALLDAAADFVRSHGRDRLIGPMDFTMNDECGLLVEGAERDPMVLEPWHPPYYQALIEGRGLTKTQDLFIWELYFGQLRHGESFHPLIHRAAEKSEQAGVRIRSMRRADMRAEVERFREVYNEAWGENWGFVPITEDEVDFQAANLKQILSEDWAMIAELDGEVVGAALTLPDYNQVFKRMNGRLLPFGWLKFLRWRRRITDVRVFALGVKHAHQHLGVAAQLYVAQADMAAKLPQKGGDMGWTLESNKGMNRALEGMGGTVVKRYRIYEQAL